MKMQNAEMEFVSFEAQDVITTSGELTFTVAGLGDKVQKNATIVTSDGRMIYKAEDYTANWSAEVAKALGGEVGSSLDARTTKFNIGESQSKEIHHLFNTTSSSNGDGDGTAYKDYDGIYKWISNGGYFLKQ